MKPAPLLHWLTPGAAVLVASSALAQQPPAQPPTPPGAPPAGAAAAPPGAAPGTPANTLPGAAASPPTSMEAIQQAVDTPYRPKPAGYRVKFNLQDADLAELVNHISGMTGKRFIYGPKVRQIKATVVSPTPVTLAEAYEAFLSILEANGMTVVPQGQFLKIVDSGGVVTRTTPIYSRGAPIPDTDRYVTRLYRLQHTGAVDTAALLQKFKSKEGDISVYEPGQLLILTDTGAQIQRMIRIIEEVDVGAAGNKMWIEPVHNGTAEDMAKQINDLFDLGKKGGTGGLTKVVAVPDTNQLIVVGTEDSYLKLLELMNRLESEPEASDKLHVLPLQHAVAEELSNTLNQMLQGANKKDGQPSLFEGEIRVTPDKATNSLLITSSGRDYAQLRLVIDELDMPRRQVFIEAVIMDVSVDHSARLGVSYHGGGMPDLIGNDPSLVYGGLNPLNSILPPTDPNALQGLALGVRGPELEGSSELLGIGVSVPAFGVVLNALAQSGDANVLATPHILATDNVAAEINVGENIPLQENIGGGLSNLASLAGAGGQTNPAALGSLALGGFGFNTPRQDVGTKIKVTPHINESNQVRLEIQEEISERGASSGALGAVSITQRTASTTLVVDDQQTVVIGGLMRDAIVKSKDKIPVLGDLPVLGFLFRSSTTQTRKTNLLLVLTPYVIHEQSDLRRIFERKMQERQEFLDRYFVFAGDDWAPPKDYVRTNGLVENIRQAQFKIDERLRLEKESAPGERVLHEPTEPLELPTVPSPSGVSKPARTTKPAAKPKTPAKPKPAAPAKRPPARQNRPRGALEPPLENNKMARSVVVDRVE